LLETRVNAERMVARHSATRARWNGLEPFLIHAVGQALVGYPLMRLHLRGGHLVPSAGDAVAVDTGHAGRRRTIASPAFKTPEQIAEELATLDSGAAAAPPVASQPTTIVVGCLEGPGIERFAMPCDPPDTVVVTAGSVSPNAVVRDGRLVAQQTVSLTLGVDPRVIGRRYAADFLRAVVQILENL